MIYSFTPPVVNPDTICFWKKRTIISVGMVTIVVAAATSPHRISNCVRKKEIATGTV
jgi:hypothetical protein